MTSPGIQYYHVSKIKQHDWLIYSWIINEFEVIQVTFKVFPAPPFPRLTSLIFAACASTPAPSAPQAYLRFLSSTRGLHARKISGIRVIGKSPPGAGELIDYPYAYHFTGI
jgi:hypothetical protein